MTKKMTTTEAPPAGTAIVYDGTAACSSDGEADKKDPEKKADRRRIANRNTVRRFRIREKMRMEERKRSLQALLVQNDSLKNEKKTLKKAIKTFQLMMPSSNSTTTSTETNSSHRLPVPHAALPPPASYNSSVATMSELNTCLSSLFQQQTPAPPVGATTESVTPEACSSAYGSDLLMTLLQGFVQQQQQQQQQQQHGSGDQTLVNCQPHTISAHCSSLIQHVQPNILNTLIMDHNMQQQQQQQYPEDHGQKQPSNEMSFQSPLLASNLPPVPMEHSQHIPQYEQPPPQLQLLSSLQALLQKIVPN